VDVCPPKDLDRVRFWYRYGHLGSLQEGFDCFVVVISDPQSKQFSRAKFRPERESSIACRSRRFFEISHAKSSTRPEDVISLS